MTRRSTILPITFATLGIFTILTLPRHAWSRTDLGETLCELEFLNPPSALSSWIGRIFPMFGKGVVQLDRAQWRKLNGIVSAEAQAFYDQHHRNPQIVFQIETFTHNEQGDDVRVDLLVRNLTPALSKGPATDETTRLDTGHVFLPDGNPLNLIEVLLKRLIREAQDFTGDLDSLEEKLSRNLKRLRYALSQENQDLFWQTYANFQTGIYPFERKAESIHRDIAKIDLAIRLLAAKPKSYGKVYADYALVKERYERRRNGASR